LTKEEKKAKKLAKKEAKSEKKEAKAEKANAKYKAKAEKKHAKAYASFVKETEKKNAKLQAKAQKDGKEFVPIAVPSVDEYQTKKEIKAEKATTKAYGKYVKKLEKKNATAEKKCAKKGKPFVPVQIPTEEEFANSSTANQNKAGKIILMIILLLLIWFLIYFIIMYINAEYVAPVVETTTVAEDDSKAAADYELYSNPHEITTTPDYNVTDAKRLLKQTIHDNYKTIGYTSDVSNSAISFNNSVQTVNGADCYMFTCSGKQFAVAVKLSAVYYVHNGEYTPLSFANTEILFD
jgi:chemotaxis protein histidine kinase CheA